MNGVTSLIIRAMAMVMLTGAAVYLMPEGPVRSVARSVCAALLIATLLSPVTGFTFRVSGWFAEGKALIGGAVLQGEQKAAELQESAVAGQIARYAEKRAKEEGVEVQVELDAWKDEEENFFIKKALALYPKGQEGGEDVVQRILTEECGIAAEIQEHRHEME